MKDEKLLGSALHIQNNLTRKGLEIFEQEKGSTYFCLQSKWPFVHSTKRSTGDSKNCPLFNSQTSPFHKLDRRFKTSFQQFLSSFHEGLEKGSRKLEKKSLKFRAERREILSFFQFEQSGKWKFSALFVVLEISHKMSKLMENAKKD